MYEKYNWKEIQKSYNNNGTYRTIMEKYGLTNYMIRKAVKKGDLIMRSRSEAIKLGHKNSSYVMSEETKKKISISRTKYLKENPDQVPYLLNHSSKESYPEKYFTQIFKNEKLKVEKYFRFDLYELDFAIPEKKIDIEIDGSQHRVDPKIVESDKKRDQLLKEDGWDIIRVNWSKYQKLEKKDKKEYVRDLISYVNGLIDKKPTIRVKRLTKGKDLCECGNEKEKKSKQCIKCRSESQRKVKNRPSLDQLLKDIEETSYVKTGEKYGVSDNTIRKWIKFYQN